MYVLHACVCKRSHFLLGIQIITLEIRPSMKAWGEKAKAGVWPARASLHLGITLRSLNGGIPTLRFSGTSNLTQAFLMDVLLSRTGPKKNASSDAKTKYFHLACRSFSAPRLCNRTFGTAHIKMLHKTKNHEKQTVTTTCRAFHIIVCIYKYTYIYLYLYFLSSAWDPTYLTPPPGIAEMSADS